MISVLIPTYNYNVYPLVQEVHKQLDKTGVAFEILVYDDHSTQPVENFQVITDLPNVVYQRLFENIGRLAIRHQMAKDARYDFLLFMDADVFPKDRFFISKLLKTLEQKKADVYFGGIKVPEHPFSPDKMLRWKYGKERESLTLSERITKPYHSVICGSLVVSKPVFLQETESMLPIKKYGLDTLFSYRLMENKRKVHHYNNPVVHLGLETNEAFIQKTKNALQTYKYLIDKGFLPKDYIKLTRYAYKIKKICPLPVCRLFYSIFLPLILLNLKSTKPSLKIFDVYKLLYFSQLKMEKRWLMSEKLQRDK